MTRSQKWCNGNTTRPRWEGPQLTSCGLLHTRHVCVCLGAGLAVVGSRLQCEDPIKGGCVCVCLLSWKKNKQRTTHLSEIVLLVRTAITVQEMQKWTSFRFIERILNPYPISKINLDTYIYEGQLKSPILLFDVPIQNTTPRKSMAAICLCPELRPVAGYKNSLLWSTSCNIYSQLLSCSLL